MNNDVTYRHKTAVAAKEIKASAHYGYIVNGITLDGSKFTAGELLTEGQCLVRDDATGKYEKYADGNAASAKIVGASNITPADLSGIHANTIVTITVDGDVFTMTNAALKAIGAATTEAEFITAVKAAVNGEGLTLDKVAQVSAVANKLTIVSMEKGVTISVAGVWGTAANEATVEGVFGLGIPATNTGAGNFPAGKSNPVILDESVKFVLKDDGSNPDITAGQVLVHGSVYSGMLTGVTASFKAACKLISFVE